MQKNKRIIKQKHKPNHKGIFKRIYRKSEMAKGIIIGGLIVAIIWCITLLQK